MGHEREQITEIHYENLKDDELKLIFDEMRRPQITLEAGMTAEQYHARAESIAEQTRDLVIKMLISRSI